MPDPASPVAMADVTGLVVRVAAGAGSVAMAFKLLTIVARKLDLNLQSDEANAKGRVVAEAYAQKLQDRLDKTDDLLREARSMEADYLKRIGMLEVRIATLEGLIAELKEERG